MVCVYCKRPCQPTGVEHVFPEALGCHDWTLPLGTVCDDCNNYLGRLDAALVAHPHLSAALMFFDVPGKSGEPRKKLGYFHRTEQGIRIEAPRKRTRSVRVSERGVSVVRDAPAEFDDGRFRRGLYKIAFNLFVSAEGPAEATASYLDSVRRYIREPRSGEAWAYGQRVLSADDEMEVRFDRIYACGKLGYRLTLGVDQFFVDLLDPNRLLADLAGQPDLLVHTGK